MLGIFTTGNLVRIKDFLFPDGTRRDKYLFVLFANAKEAFLIYSLTTSKTKFAPTATKFGCHFNPKLFTYFFFPALHKFGNGGFHFDLDTYIYFRTNVIKVPVESLLKYVQAEDPLAVVNLETLTTAELIALLNCVIRSAFTPNDLKAVLTTFRDSL